MRLLAFGLELLLLVRLASGGATQAFFDVGVDKLDEHTDNILAAAHDASVFKNCASCQALLLPLKRLAGLGDKAFVSSMVKICKTRKVCAMAFPYIPRLIVITA